MDKKEQISNILGMLLAGSLTAVGIHCGGDVGLGVVANLGVGLAGILTHDAFLKKLQHRWMEGDKGIKNHDIQQAFVRAYIHALDSLKDEYLAKKHAGGFQKDEIGSIEAFFKELKEYVEDMDLPTLTSVISSKVDEKTLIEKPEKAIKQFLEYVYKKDTRTYPSDFKDFCNENLPKEIQFWFLEELKKESGTKAWRAYQRLMYESLRDYEKDIKQGVITIQEKQQELKKELKARLDTIESKLDKLDKLPGNSRTTDEPFQKELDEAIKDIKATLERIEKTGYDTNVTAHRTEAKIDRLTNILVPPLPTHDIEIPPIPENIQRLFDRGRELRMLGKIENSRKVFKEALDLAKSQGHKLAIAHANFRLSTILIEDDKKPDEAKILLQECLKEYKASGMEPSLAKTLFVLGVADEHLGNLDEAEASFSQSFEISKKHAMVHDVGCALHQLGLLEDRRGNSKKAMELYDQALTYFLRIYQEHDAETETDAARFVGYCYHHKGLVYLHQGNLQEAEISFTQALDYSRKSDLKTDLGLILYLLAKLKYLNAEYDVGDKYLAESIQIFEETDDNSGKAECLDLKARLHFSLGKRDEAITLWKNALKAVENTTDFYKMQDYLNKLGRLFLEDRKLDESKNYFKQAKELCRKENLLDGYADTLEGMASIAYIENNLGERDKLLSEGVITLEKLLLKTQDGHRKAFRMGQIGFYYEKMEKYQEALNYYNRSKTTFSSISDIHGMANSLGSIARMVGKLGKKDKEFDTYRELKKLLDGTPYYEMIAGTAINLGQIYMSNGNFHEAKILFEEASTLCQKYNLVHLSPSIKESLERLNVYLTMRKPPEISLTQMIDEMFKLFEWFPEAKDGLFRLCMEGRQETLYANIRNNTGIKLMICQDDIDKFSKIVEMFRPYTDLCLEVVNTEYPESAFEAVPYPKDKTFFPNILLILKDS